MRRIVDRRLLPGGAVIALIGDMIEPVGRIRFQGRRIGKALAIPGVVFDLFDTGFDLAFTLRIIPFAGPDTEARRRGDLVTALVQAQLAKYLADHHPLGLVVHAFLWHAAEVAKCRLLAIPSDCAASGTL